MSWKCFCKEDTNLDESKVCKNCGKRRPKYLGVKLDLGSTEEMSSEQKAVWYLMIAYSYFLKSDENLSLHRELLNKVGNENYNQDALRSEMIDAINTAKEDCVKSLDIIKNNVESLSINAQFKDDDDIVVDISSLKSRSYFNIGAVYFRKDIFERAIKNFQSSFDYDPNQVSIYNIAMATINLEVEGGGIFSSSKKKQAAAKTKQDQEIELLKKTIQFAPFSELGIKCGKLLLEKYNIIY